MRAVRAREPDEFGFCPACGAPLVPTTSREVRKVVTVLFCDLTGSTAIGERTDPEALRALMNRCYETARGVLERHGGTVEKPATSRWGTSRKATHSSGR